MKFNLLLLLLAMGGPAIGQSAAPVLLATCTSEGSVNNAQIFWSLGESSVSTLVGTSNQITQGFWQPEVLTITGVNSPLQADYGIACMPNPVEDALHITFTNDRPLHVTLFSLDGRLLLRETAIKSGQILSLAALPASLYLLRFTMDDGNWILTQKIVKQ